MYSITSAYGVARAQGATWQAQSVGSLTGVQAFSLFRGLYLTLSSALLSGPVSIDIYDYQAVLAYDSRTLDTIFAEWTDTAPLISVTVPTYTSKKAVFTDVLRSNYTVHKSIPGAHFTSSQDDKLKTEMQLTRPGTDMRLIPKYCLVTANGYFYKTEATREICYAAEAGKTLLKSRSNHVGLLSFEKIGQITTHPIVEASILAHTLNTPLYDGVSVSLPAVSLVGKTLLMVVCGHLHFQSDGIFTPISDTRALLRPGYLSLLERYQESHDKIDWSTIVGNAGTDTVVNGPILRSDAAIKAILMHPQTFWVVVDTPNLVKARLPLRSLPLPGQFISPVEPKELLLAGSGYVLEYWKVYQDGEWAVNCSGVRPGKAISGTIGRDGWIANTAIRNVPYAVYSNIQAHLLDIIADQVQP